MRKPFNVELTEGERASLEVARKRLGLRSQADVIRAWIAEFEIVPSDHPSKPRWTDEEAAEITSRSTQLKISRNKANEFLSRAHGLTREVQLGPAPIKPGARLKKR